MEIEQLVQKILLLAGDRKRFIIAICGAPGAGKSTMAAALVKALVSNGEKNCAVVVPMDGFHLDDRILGKRGQQARKGAANTFDAGGFVHTISRIKQHRQDVFIPLFDRSLELSRAAAQIVEQSHRFIVVEGNYLLLNEPPWTELKPLFDFSIFLDVDIEELEKRSIARWLYYDYTLEQARQKCQSNDIINARYVIDNSTPADLVLKNQ